MADRLAFHYLPGDSALHRWDARCKLPGLLVTSFGLLRMDMIGLSLFSILLAGMVVQIRLSWISFLRDLKGWLMFLALIFILQAVDPSADTPFVSWLPVSGNSLYTAARACWRLLLVLSYATLFTFTTRPRQLQESIIWFLAPFPFIPARRIALMVSLTMRMLPLILDQLEEVRMALKCRNAKGRGNPLLRIKHLVLPIIRRSLLRADELAVALASRGYREDLPVLLPWLPLSHSVALACLIALVAGASVMLKAIP